MTNSALWAPDGRTTLVTLAILLLSIVVLAAAATAIRRRQPQYDGRHRDGGITMRIDWRDGWPPIWRCVAQPVGPEWWPPELLARLSAGSSEGGLRSLAGDGAEQGETAPALPLPGSAVAGQGQGTPDPDHDEHCEAEFIFGPMAYSPCGCAQRQTEHHAVTEEIAAVIRAATPWPTADLQPMTDPALAGRPSLDADLTRTFVIAKPLGRPLHYATEEITQ